MKIDLKKKDLINLVKGTWPNGGGFRAMVYLENKKLMTFVGNQWNENWAWNSEELNKLNEKELMQLYKDCQKGDKFWDNV